MHIKTIEIENCFKHSKSNVDLPDTGIVLITGTNGAGKSSLCDAVSYTLWGKTIRGTPPWRKDGSAGSMTISTPDLVVRREKPQSRAATLAYGPPNKELKSYGTPTKAQKDLDSQLLDYGTWSKTSVFQADELGAFTKATDAERKRLIEKLTDSDRFDPALKKARDDRKDLNVKIRNSEKEVAVLEERLSGVEKRRRELEKDVKDIDIPKPVDEDALHRKLQKYKKYIRSLKADINKTQTQLKNLDSAEMQLRIEYRNAKAELERLDIDKCPTCEQVICEDKKQRLRDCTAAAERKFKDRHLANKDKKAELEDFLEESEEELASLEGKIRKIEDTILEASTLADRIKDLKEEKLKREELLKKVYDLKKETTDRLELLEKSLAEHTAAINEVVACEQVLGLQGVRAHIVGEALGGIERMVNMWLSRFGKEAMAIKLSPYSEKSNTDALSDKISLTVLGCGDGYGYDAASRGEKRRIDVAFVLAFGEFAAAASGSKQGTLWMDEILDGLDDDGIEAVSESLNDLSQNRAIVLITHRQDLASSLKPVKHLHISEGVITDVGASLVKAR